MNVTPDALCFGHCTVDTRTDTSALRKLFFTQSVCLKKAYHTIHSPGFVKNSSKCQLTALKKW